MRKPFLILVLSAVLAMLANAQQNTEQTVPKTPTEIISLRTERSETFDNHDGTRTVRIYSGEKYHRDNGEYKTFDISVREEIKDEFTRVVNTENYIYRYNPADKSKGSSFTRGGYYVKYVPTDNWAGKTSTTTPVNAGIKENIIFTSEADSSVSWKILTNARVSFSDGILTFMDDTGAFLFMVKQAVAWDAKDVFLPVAVSYKDDILSYELSSQKI